MQTQTNKVQPIKLFVKYEQKYPYLPEAVADTKTELARILHKNANVVFSAFSKNISTYKEIEYMPEVYPDNAGGCWYYHPITGEVILVKD